KQPVARTHEHASKPFLPPACLSTTAQQLVPIKPDQRYDSLTCDARFAPLATTERHHWRSGLCLARTHARSIHPKQIVFAFRTNAIPLRRGAVPRRTRSLCLYSLRIAKRSWFDITSRNGRQDIDSENISQPKRQASGSPPIATRQRTSPKVRLVPNRRRCMPGAE